MDLSADQQQQQGSRVAATPPPALDALARLHLDSLAEQLAVASTAEVLQRAQAAAHEHARAAAVQALTALADPELGEAVVGTAAALVAEAAAAAAAARLRAQIPPALRHAAAEAAALATAQRGRAMRGAAVQPQATGVATAAGLDSVGVE
jgi:hypothetical protein